MLFFLHRYVPFIGHIAVLIYALGNLVPGEKSCQAYILFHQFLLAFNQAMVAVPSPAGPAHLRIFWEIAPRSCRPVSSLRCSGSTRMLERSYAA